MTPRDLYEWAVIRGVEDCDIAILHTDDKDCCVSTTDVQFADNPIQTKPYGTIVALK